MHTTAADSWLSRKCASWNRFWFAPSDPTVLAAIRILTGMVAFYTLFAYCFDLQELIGENAWFNLELRREQYRDAPVIKPSMDWPPPPGSTAPAPSPRNQEEENYYQRWGVDPRDQLTRGMTIWSIWFHVTDPMWMNVIHSGFMVCCFLFTIGCATRVTSALTWFGILSYIHRAPASTFGADTMTVVLLLYLMIGPSGAALSIDRLIAGWWARRHGLPAPPLAPMVSATLALRLIQVHTCIIYGMAGLSKLQGVTWWTGDAPWGTLANFEYAPMQSPLYLDFLYFLAQKRWLYEVTMFIGAMGTLVFEIGYPFLIWRPGFRTVWLWMAVLLHAGIGMFMGLRAFSILMLAFNLAFVSPETIHWALGKLSPRDWWAKETTEAVEPDLGPELALTPGDKGIKR